VRLSVEAENLGREISDLLAAYAGAGDDTGDGADD
jgi:hypothetical protein